MAYNDVAWDSENPFPGKLYNKKDGKDHYEGCIIDFVGKDVNKNNFEAILKGDLSGLNTVDGNSTKKVLKTNEESKVFVYFADHGAPGHLMFPEDVIYADELNKTIAFMHENKMYDELVLFIEACESGSLFQHVNLS